MIAIFRKILVLILLFFLVLLPVVGTGLTALALVKSAKSEADISRLYEKSALLLWWQPNLYEQAGLHALDDPQREISLLEIASRNYGLSAAGELALGKAYLSVGKTNQAIQIWEKMVLDGKVIPEVAQELAGIYRSSNKLEDEKRILAAWLKASANDPAANERLGTILAAEATPHAVDLLKNAAERSGAAKQRTSRLIEILEKDAADPGFELTEIGQALANLNEWQLAENAVTKAVSVKPDYPEAWAWLGVIRQHNQQPGAQAALEKAERLNPNSAGIHALFGTYWLVENNPVNASEQYQRATDLEPSNPAWWAGLGSAETKINLAKALTDYTNAVHLAPDQAIYWYDLASFCVENSSYMEDYGLKAALYAYALEPKNILYIEMLGRIQMELGNYPEAEVMLRKAMEMNQAQDLKPMLQFEMGLLYLRENQMLKARNMLDEVILSDPNGVYGKQAQKLKERYLP